MQEEILARNPSPKLQVLAVWFDMLAADARSRWPGLLTDPRVVHLWDERRVVGRAYAEQGYGPAIVWDAFFLYDPDVRWTEHPPRVRAWGRTIVATREKLRDELAAIWRGAP